MRILMVAARYQPFMGGIETHIHEVGPRLVAHGHSVEVLTTDPWRTLPVEEEVGAMRVRRVPAWPKGLDLYVAPAVHAEVRRGDWDVVHFQGYNTFVAPIGMIAAIQCGIPFVLTFHSGGHSSRLRNAIRPVQHALLRPLVARAARLIGVSEFEADFFSATMGVPRERFIVVPNGAEMPAASPGVEVDPHLVVSVGRLERYKGHHRVIAALPELIRRVPDARLRVVGTGPYEAELRRLVAALGLDDRVTIAAIPGSERQGMADLVASAGLVVLFSEYEAHPVAIVEAVSLRRPVLVSDTSGLRELADKGLCRAVACDATSQEMAGAMAEEISIRRKLPDVVLPDWEACAQALSEVYRDVLAGRTLVRSSPGEALPLPPAKRA
ncbi:MAG: glycosyltransferase family 4 protein [Bradyrhizobium sp.]